MKTYVYSVVVLALISLSVYAIKSYQGALSNARDQGFSQCNQAHQEADNEALTQALADIESLNEKYLDADRRANKRAEVVDERVKKIRAVDWSDVVIPDSVDSMLTEDDNEIRLYQAGQANL